ncbi:DUF3618 domain-containing protein [Diaminobutyricimonas sp. LJ205]|uniref:DUF3618 domain-containing protein n=1 Tax=Diaminobutyricimonas sp. LJ205 TaxID=2683590 RepID=UPI0012F4FE70|nr:DUF3618 domain-containing protein [Diaminobutyricimonas sp. LJ205]
MNDTDRFKAEATRARADLAETLDAIEDKFNIPKQSKLFAERAKTSYQRNPVPWIIGATAASIVVVGMVAWAIFSDD